MNAEQKQRAIQMLRRFSQANPRTLHADNAAVDMATLLQELIDAPEPAPMQALTDTDIARIYRNIFGGNRWPSDCYPEFARAIESAALGAAQQPEPPADLVRDAERWLSEHDLELLVTFGMQADDCDADGHTLSKEQTRRLCELGVLRNVGFGRHEMTAFGDSIFGLHFSQGISLPLQTYAEHNAAIEREILGENNDCN